jgi:ADP-ribose pyrophosphatase
MSDDDLRWTLGARTEGAEYRIFRTHFRDAPHPRTGAMKRFSLIEATDWVNIIAITNDERVVLIRQYRPGVDRVCLEIPGGMVDPGEDAQTAAARELAEETGYTAGRWDKLGAIAPNPAIQNNLLHTYLATGAAQTQEPHFDGSELIEIDTASLDECYAMVRDGRIEHALVVAAFGHLALRSR